MSSAAPSPSGSKKEVIVASRSSITTPSGFEITFTIGRIVPKPSAGRLGTPNPTPEDAL
jgi:hypothetical protein